MIKNGLREGLVIIILFVVVNVTPVMNASLIEYEETYDEDPKPGLVIHEFYCEFNLTFFGNVTRAYPIKAGPITLIERARSIDTSVQPIANLTIFNTLLGRSYSIEIYNTLWFLGIYLWDIYTNMPEGQESNTGFFHAKALYLRINT